jgi:hypothetical protein
MCARQQNIRLLCYLQKGCLFRSGRQKTDLKENLLCLYIWSGMSATYSSLVEHWQALRSLKGWHEAAFADPRLFISVQYVRLNMARSIFTRQDSLGTASFVIQNNNSQSCNLTIVYNAQCDWWNRELGRELLAWGMILRSWHEIKID